MNKKLSLLLAIFGNENTNDEICEFSTSVQICVKAITEYQSNHIGQLFIISIPKSIEKNSNVK